jgi:hypothetical protein
MTEKILSELVQWIAQEIKPIDHGEVYIVFKIRDHQVWGFLVYYKHPQGHPNQA